MDADDAHTRSAAESGSAESTTLSAATRVGVETARSHKDTNHFCMKSLKNDTDGQNTDSDLKDMVINGDRGEG